MKKLFIVLGLLALLVIGGYFSLPVYREWKEKRFLAQARAYLAKEDYRNAALSARQAINLNPNDARAVRIMAQITEQLRSPVAVAWWQRVVQLEPNSLTNQLDLARSAIMLGNNAVADLTLRAIPEARQTNATFHQFAAIVAMADNNIAKADWHFGRATELDPQNKAFQFNRAIIHLQAKNPEIVAAALKTLEALTADPVFRKDALRHLVMAAVHERQLDRAARYVAELQTAAGANFQDRILQLSVLQAATSPDFAATLEKLKTEAAKSADEANTLGGWMMAHGMTAPAGQWLASLPDPLQTQPAVRMARADVLMVTHDWKGLETFLADQNWGELDFVRYAQLARATQEQQQTMAAQAHWQNATRLAGDKLKALSFLIRLAIVWNWEQEQESLLWLITQRYPAERWALQSLSQLYTKSGNTRGLQKVFTTLLDYNSADIVAKNNYASVTLLLNPQSARALELARAGYDKAPQNPAFAATHAYALHLRGQTVAGLKILGELPEAQLKVPGIAIYYGVLLAAAGETNKAKIYLDLAATGTLLPEEKELLLAARAATKAP